MNDDLLFVLLGFCIGSVGIIVGRWMEFSRLTNSESPVPTFDNRTRFLAAFVIQQHRERPISHKQVEYVAERMRQARQAGKWASAPDGENNACAEAAIHACHELYAVDYIRCMELGGFTEEKSA